MTTPRREHDREALFHWIVFRAFEESFLAEGRARVHWRNFPTDEPHWRERATHQGVLFLLAREYLAQSHPVTDKIKQTCEAIELAEGWSQEQQIPEDMELEPLALVLWYRRSLNIARQLVRDDDRAWQNTDSIDETSSHEQDSQLDNHNPLTPDHYILRNESIELLHTLVLAVTRDLVDEQILMGMEAGHTEKEIAEQLNVTRGSVRGRWNTLIRRTRLLFKVYSRQQEEHPCRWKELTQTSQQSSLSQSLRQVLTPPQEQATAQDFWLYLYRLSVMLAEKEKQAPDQPSLWNALSQTWSRATEKLLVHDALHPDSVLLRDLVFFWLKHARQQKDEGALPSMANKTLSGETSSQESKQG